MKIKTLTRVYQLKTFSNYQKLEDVRYSSSRYKLFLQHFVTQLYFKPIPFLSTRGMGTLANQAQRQAMGIIRAHRAATAATGEKSNCPQIKLEVCPASISKSKADSFDYWVAVMSQWKNKIRIPANSHKALNDKLRAGWKLSDHCELTNTKTKKWYVRVFVTKEVPIPEPKSQSLGVDVGITQSVTRSDGYLGKNIGKVMSRERDAQRERSRQGHKKKPFKTLLKQQLDIEVTRALRRSKLLGWNLAVENPKVLSNLKYDRWARSYFARRATERAIEEGVYVGWINPAYTSITCYHCGKVDKRSRVKRALFKCTSCKKELHADLNAACNIARKGQESLRKKTINPLGGTLYAAA